MMNSENPIKHLENIEEFIKHNLRLGYITPETTVNQLLEFTKNIKENYIPMLKQISEMYLKL